MSEYKIFCGSTVDLPEEYLKSRDIVYIPFHFEMNGKQYDDDLGKSMSYDCFYKKISEGAMPTTSQPNIEENIAYMEPVLKEGKDILFINFSSGLSGAYNSTSIAVNMLSEQYPERKIMHIDSFGASSGYGLIVDSAADLKNEGMKIEELYNWVEKNRLKLNHWFFSTDLQHYKRGGRISSTSATIGTILGICPLMNMNEEGKLIPRKKIKGKKKVIKEIVKEMEDSADDGYEYSKKCFISHSDCYEDAKKVAELIYEKFPKINGDIMINSVGTVIGSHTGLGTVALFFYGKERKE